MPIRVVPSPLLWRGVPRARAGLPVDGDLPEGTAQAQSLGRAALYLLPAVVYAGILCSSAFAQVISRLHLGPVLLGFLAISVLTGGLLFAQTPSMGVPEQRLITFLERHHLTSGYGSYWTANTTTLSSDGQVRVLPVFEHGGKIDPCHWHANAAWYGARQLRTIRFVVIDSSVLVRSFEAAVIASFGVPEHTYYLPSYPTYVIFTWDHPIAGSGPVRAVTFKVPPKPTAQSVGRPIQTARRRLTVTLQRGRLNWEPRPQAVPAPTRSCS